MFDRDDVTDTGLRPGQVGYNDYLKVIYSGLKKYFIIITI
jgi:hypothetical protein